MNKLSEFKLVENVSEISSNNFVVILSASYWTSEHPSKKNIIEYKDKTYQLTIIKGTWYKILANSKKFANEKKGALAPVRGYEIVAPSFIEDEKGTIVDIFAFKTAQDMIIDCAVFMYPHRIEVFDIDEEALRICIEDKAKFTSATLN